ncbi:MAG: LptA/OstA family protein [Vicinamibacterales bacterium]|nr:LptA/OstA family protein [Vicinamibacterales bacterium]
MASWQQRTRLAVGLFAVLFAVGVYFAIGERAAPTAMAPLERLDPTAAVEIQGGDAVRLSGTTRDFAIRYDSSLTYTDGRSRFLGAQVTVENRGTRDFEITARELVVGANQATLDMTGAVRMTASDGLVIEGERASYSDAEGRLSVPGAVRFTRGRVEGRGVGLTYDRGRDMVTILDQAVVHFAGGDDAPPMNVEAGTASHLQTDRVMRFERGVTMTRGGERISADASTVWLYESSGGPSTIELRGQAQVGGSGLGAFQSMQARDITLHYDEATGTLRQAVLVEGGRVALAGEGARRQTLAGDYIDATIAPEGGVTGLSARDRVSVTLPGARNTPARTVRSQRLFGSGTPAQGLTDMRFETAVEFQESASGDRGARRGRADVLDLRLDEAGAIREAQFRGAVRFSSGALDATGQTADYDIAGGRLTLSGRTGTASPRVTDRHATIDAGQITVALEGGDLSATGTVRSVLQPRADDAGADTKRPALLEGTQAVNITADALEYDGDLGRGVYEGSARLWQGDTSIQAGRLVLDETRGDLTATGDVRSTLMLGTADGGSPPAVTIGRAQSFTYAEDTRQVVYETAAHLNGPDGDVRAARIAVHLAAATRAIDRLEARGDVTVRLDGREATGTDLVHHAADARYEMRGAPVRLVEPCRETTGRTLTFFRGADRILVDGNEETRTQTKGGGKCPEPRFE